MNLPLHYCCEVVRHRSGPHGTAAATVVQNFHLVLLYETGCSEMTADSPVSYFRQASLLLFDLAQSLPEKKRRKIMVYLLRGDLFFSPYSFII